jgi:DNA topoisomerase I
MPQTANTAEPAKAHARAAGLTYVSDLEPGVRRKREGTGFSYWSPNGKLIRDPATVKRIRSLAVPPAWTEVWICPAESGHIQATGRDDRGRKQYRYHDGWRDVRDRDKYERLLDFARLLPRIREQVDADMGKRGAPREKVLATVVSLLDKTLIRVGNGEYAKDNGSYGLTTLRTRHLEVQGTELRFHFKGKSGKTWRLSVKDRRIARVVRSIQDLPGQHLFQYLDDEGSVRSIDSTAVNDYLREIAGPDVSAKDFRTWAGTVLAARALKEFELVDSQAGRKKNVVKAVEVVARKLGNTRAVCRKCYIHPAVIDSYLDGSFLETAAQRARKLGKGIGDLRPEEAAVLVLLQRRLQAESKKQKSAARRRKAA